MMVPLIVVRRVVF